METSRRHKDVSAQREFERMRKGVTVGDRAEAVVASPQAQPATKTQTGTFNLTLQYKGGNINFNTTKIDFLDVDRTFNDTPATASNISFRVLKIGSKTTVEAYGDGFLPNGTIHQTLRHTTGTAKEWIANDRLRNRGDGNHTYNAAEGAIEIKSFAGETGTALRVLGVAGSNVYGIYADTDNQTAIIGQATGSGYGVIGDANTGTAVYGASVSGYGVHAVSANDAIYGNSANGYALHAVSSNNTAIYSESSHDEGWAVNGINNQDFVALHDGGGIRSQGTGDKFVGFEAEANGDDAVGFYCNRTGTAGGNAAYFASTGDGITAMKCVSNGVDGYAAHLYVNDTRGIALYAQAASPATQAIVAAGTVDTSAAYYVDGVQVVSNQGAAVADATDAASVIARLNDLLARLRTHGLIAT